ncbi:MAG: amidase family protein [Gemmatimonadota bacterium]|nr:amidase family protein [Gemmatimonadota bacterium]
MRWWGRCVLCVALAGVGYGCAEPASAPRPFEVAEASIPMLQAALAESRTTSAELVDLYLARIAAYDDAGPALNAIIRLNPRARERAAALDREQADGMVRGPLHGIPVLMKDKSPRPAGPTVSIGIALNVYCTIHNGK